MKAISWKLEENDNDVMIMTYEIMTKWRNIGVMIVMNIIINEEESWWLKKEEMTAISRRNTIMKYNGEKLINIQWRNIRNDNDI